MIVLEMMKGTNHALLSVRLSPLDFFVSMTKHRCSQEGHGPLWSHSPEISLSHPHYAAPPLPPPPPPPPSIHYCLLVDNQVYQ